MKHRAYDQDKDAPDGRLNNQFVVRVTDSEAAFLDRMMAEGGYPSRNALVRSILQTIIEDERRP